MGSRTGPDAETSGLTDTGTVSGVGDTTGSGEDEGVAAAGSETTDRSSLGWGLGGHFA